ncbi:MAG: hypothetical protein AAF919_06415 [Pseudomonadota bacterium]
MKTLIASALIAAAAVAGTAQAQQISTGAAAAIAHFNGDHDTQDNRIALSALSETGTSVSTRSGQLSGAFGRFNADHDTQDNIRGQQGATLVSGVPGVAQSIFDAIRAESLEDE